MYYVVVVVVVVVVEEHPFISKKVRLISFSRTLKICLKKAVSSPISH
jgi:hypothetical protein